MNNHDLSFYHIMEIWSDILYDLSNPNGRSIYDSFWQNHRPYYVGVTFVYISFLLFLMYFLLYLK